MTTVYYIHILPENVFCFLIKTLFLRNKSKDAKGWVLDVMNCVDLIKKEQFTLDELYKFEQKLKSKYPKNNFLCRQTQKKVV